MKKKYLIIFLVLVFIACKFTYWLAAYPNPDEAYYWLWGRRPALSYLDHPALQSWVQSILYRLFGKSLFILRLPAMICTVIIAVIINKILKKIYNDSFTTNGISILVMLSLPLFFLFTTFAWPDYLMITMSLVSCYFWLNYLTDVWNGNKGTSKDIFLAFAFIGLAGISKYNAVFIAVGIAFTIIANKKFHGILKDYRIYLGIILGLIIISPIFIWNAQNNFGSFQYNLSQRVAGPIKATHYFNGNIGGFVIGSLIMLSPFFWLALIKSWKSISQTETNSYKIVYVKLAKNIFILTSLFFLILSVSTNVLYYWNLPAYLLILPLVAGYNKSKNLITGSLIYSAVLNILIVFHFSVLPLTNFIKGAEDKDGATQYGWKEIGNKIKMMQQDTSKNYRIITSDYRSASLLSHELNDINIYSISPRFDQFDFWMKNINLKNNNAIIITDDWQGMNPDLQNACAKIIPADTITINKWGYKIKQYYIFTAVMK